MRSLFGLALAALATAGGCTSYASARLVDDESTGAPEIYGDVAQREFGKRVQVKLPSDLVVAEVCARSSRSQPSRADKRSVQLTESLAEDKATFSNVSPLFVDSGGARYGDLRSAAARQQADLMLVTTMSESVRSENGVLPVLNLLVLPYFLVPSQTNDLTLHLRAAVLDVRNDLVYATFEDHREERMHATSAAERDEIEAAFDRLYAESLAKMRARVSERLRQLESAP
jgi:hypothetical protein